MSFIKQTLRLCLMAAVRRAPPGAPALDIHRSTNLRTAATHRLVAGGGGISQGIFYVYSHTGFNRSLLRCPRREQ